MKLIKKKRKLRQSQYIAFGFFIIILVGTVLLTMPFASKSGRPTAFLDALFTATSSTCVTGLVVVDTFQHWSIIGQLIILTMIQIGGLGFITIGVFFSMFLRKKIGLNQRELLQESVNAMEIGGIVKLLKKIVSLTFLFEFIGAVVLSIRFIPRMGVVEGIYNGVFHSISAFCNAGFDIMGKYGSYSSFVGYYDDIVVNVTLMLLIIIGGLGFIVWDELGRKKFNYKKYSLHTKIVVSATLVLIFGGAIMFWLFERNNLMKDMSVTGTILTSLFSSVTARTAGFNTIDTGALTDGSVMLTVILMFIGGSPGSTAGGIKTTTMVVIIMYVISSIRDTRGCNLFDRRIEDSDIQKSCTVIGLNMLLALVAILGINLVQTLPLRDVMFEVFSAIGTVGMTTGITRDLLPISRIIIIFLMYCGRIGSITFAMSFKNNKNNALVRYPAEKVRIG